MDFNFGQIEDIEFEPDASKYLSNSPNEADEACLEHFFGNIRHVQIDQDNYDFVSGDIWNIYQCNHIIEVLRPRPDKVIVTKVYPTGPGKNARRINI
jgi:hypothetical protein